MNILGGPSLCGFKIGLLYMIMSIVDQRMHGFIEEFQVQYTYHPFLLTLHNDHPIFEPNLHVERESWFKSRRFISESELELTFPGGSISAPRCNEKGKQKREKTKMESRPIDPQAIAVSCYVHKLTLRQFRIAISFCPKQWPSFM